MTCPLAGTPYFCHPNRSCPDRCDPTHEARRDLNAKKARMGRPLPYPEVEA